MQQRQQPDDLTRAIDEHMVEQDVSAQQAQNSGDNLTISSLGEYILPFFVAAMEACWLNAALIGLAGLDFLQSGSAFMPFWGPPLLLIVALVLFRRATQKEAEAEGEGTESERSPFAMPGLGLMFGVLAVLTVFLVWLHLYSATFSLFDPNWILSFGSDILALNTHLFQMVMIIAIVGYCTWRGMKLAQLEVKGKNLFRNVWSPEQIFRQLWIGLLVFLGAILIRAKLAGSGSSADDAVLVLSIPVFLYCSLAAHALARVVYIRSEHPFGLEGSIAAQERSLLSVISGVGAILGLLTIVSSAFFSSTFFSSIQPVWQMLGAVYDWLAGALAQIIVWILMPLFYFFTAWFHQGAAQVEQKPTSPVHNPSQHMKPSSTPAFIPIIVEILLPLLIFALLALLLRLALRRRKRLRISLNRKRGGDVHESIWSWQLFWTQFKAFWAGLFSRLFPARATEEEQAQIAEEINASPAARSIREIYRALLKKAAQRGHMRKRDETPHEFRRRLNEHEVYNEPQLGMLTDAYALTRYGGGAPSEHELGIVRHLWNELEQKWEAPS